MKWCLHIAALSITLIGCYESRLHTDSPDATPAGDCFYEGQSYDAGDSFPAGDGCNECGCDADGSVFCTRLSCSCDGREYCDCVGACEPLIDLGSGCLCPAEEPFCCADDPDDCGNCACGGATYIGCVQTGLCEETEVECPSDTLLTITEDGCPACVGGV